MSRMYLSPTATTFVKIALCFVECFIGLYNLITYPIRKINIRAYCLISALICVIYLVNSYLKLEPNLFELIITLVAFTVSIIFIRMLYNLLNKKVSPRVAMLINSPLGIPLNKFYYPV